jgi:hypothetical protein
MDIHITFALTIAKPPLRKAQQNMHVYVHNFMKDATVATVKGKVFHADAQKPVLAPIKKNISTNMKDTNIN